MSRVIVLAVAATLLLPAGASAHLGGLGTPARAGAEAGSPCSTGMAAPDATFTGKFGTALQGSHVMVPFEVPSGITALRVRYCHDQPETPLSAQARHTIDLGVYEPRTGGGPWGPRQLRGWGGSSHPDVTLSAEGFRAEPRGTTRAFRPGPVPAGEWALELGLAAIVGPSLGDLDGAVGYRVDIDWTRDPDYADQPYEPAPYPDAPVRRRTDWYAGDLHVHGEHSALGDAPLGEVLDYAFGEAGLDFITLSDYVGGAHWDEIGRHAGDHPKRLVVRSAEVITYRGHVNNHASATTVDHRTGPVLRLMPGGDLAPVRDARPASGVLSEIRDAGGVTQLNHVTIFPSQVPLFPLLCRGCPWDYSPAETRYELVDAIEVATGPGGLQDVPGGLGPNPFTATAVEFYEEALASGAHIAAVGSSDSHKAGRRDNPVTQAPIGQATTVLRARELSEDGIACAVRAGHTYVKVWGADRPDLRLEATAPGAGGKAIFGDTVEGEEVRFTARVLDAAPVAGKPFALQVVRNGRVVAVHPVTGDELEVRFDADGPGRYGLRLVRGSSIEAVSTPIWVEQPGPDGPRVATRSCRNGGRGGA